MKRHQKTISTIAIVLMLFLFVGLILTDKSNDDTENTKQSEKIESQNTQVAAEYENYSHISPDDFEKEMNKSDIVTLDIRTPEEFSTGYINDSINIDFYSDTFKDQLSELDKDTQYLIYCNSGNRSNTAMEMMKELEFSSVYGLDGGIQAWQGENKPVV